MPFQDDIYRIADELRAIASLGMRYAENAYDSERYTKVLALSARLVAGLEERSPDEVLVEYEGNLMHVSPILAAEAAVFRDERILLIKREDNGLWAMPGGLTEVGETWAGSAQRELHEEAGVQGKVARLLGVFDSRMAARPAKFQLYIGCFEVEVFEGEPISGPETTDVGFFPEDALPDLSHGHQLQVPLVFKLHRGEAPPLTSDLSFRTEC